MATRMYIATRDPNDGGGAAALSRFVYETAEQSGYDPCLVYNHLDRSKQIRLADPLELVDFEPDDAIEHTTINGLESKGIPVVFPEIEFTQYLLNASAWHDAIRDGDVFFVVAGTNLCALPLVRSEKPFGSWTATLLWDDRIDRLESTSWLERVRDHLSRPLLEYIERKAYNAADPLMVISEYTADRIETRYDVPGERIEVVPYPIDTERFTPEMSMTRPGRDGSVLLFAGRLNDPRKNVEFLIEAFARIYDDVPNAELWLIGADPDTSLRTAVSEHDVEDRTVFHGKVPFDELPEYYGAADIFTIPSKQEGLGIVGLEAMACGTPVVSTQCGGPEEYICDGGNGFLVPSDDLAAFAERIESLLTDDERRRAFGQEARRLIERDYAETKIRDHFVEAFDDL